MIQDDLSNLHDVGISCDLVPSATANLSLGLAAKVWKTAYITTLNAGSVAYTWGSQVKKDYVAKTADATLSVAEFQKVVALDGTSATVAVTLPAAADVAGLTCVLKCINKTHACTLVGTIDGTSGYTFAAANNTVMIYSTGTAFLFISKMVAES